MMEAPGEKRGQDLLPHEMDKYNARLQEYYAEKRVLERS